MIIFFTKILNKILKLNGIQTVQNWPGADDRRKSYMQTCKKLAFLYSLGKDFSKIPYQTVKSDLAKLYKNAHPNNKSMKDDLHLQLFFYFQLLKFIDKM